MKTTNLRAFLFYWCGQIFSIFGSEVVGYAILWYITFNSPSPLYMSISILTFVVPSILLSPLAGVLADRFNRKYVLFIADLWQALFTLILICIMTFTDYSLLILILFNGLRKIGGVFHNPTQQAVIPMLVPEDKLSRVNGLRSLSSTAANILAPIAGAVLMDRFPIEWLLWIDIITFLIAVIPLFLIQIPNVTKKNETPISSEIPTETHPKSTMLKELKEGILIIRSYPVIMALIMGAIFNNILLTPTGTLLTFYIYLDHGGTPIIFAFITGIIQIGNIAGSFIATSKKQWNHAKLTYIYGIYVVFLGHIFLGMIPKGMFWLMPIAGIMILMPLPIVNTIYITYIQIKVANEAQGRVFALDQMLSSIASPLGILISGILASYICTSIIFAIAGCLGIILNFLIHILRKYDGLTLDVNEKESPEILINPISTPLN